SLLQPRVGTLDFPSSLTGEACPETGEASPEPSRRGQGEPPGEREISSSAQGMVLVPAGAFLMGSDDSARTLANDRPQHSVFVPAFLIDQCPVSNADFLAFIAGGGYHEQSCWNTAGWQWREQHQVEHPLYWRRRKSGEWVEIGVQQSGPLRLQHPVQ